MPQVVLDQNDLNKPFTGGLGSFKACALVSVFLEKRYKANGNMDLGVCFQAMLQFIYEFDFERTVLRYPRYETDFRKVFRWFDIAQLANRLARHPAPPSATPHDAAGVDSASALICPRLWLLARDITCDHAAVSCRACFVPVEGGEISWILRSPRRSDPLHFPRVVVPKPFHPCSFGAWSPISLSPSWWTPESSQASAASP